MGKRVYISADYDQNSGDRDVVDQLLKWGNDNLHKTDFVDTAAVKSGSVSDEPDCRPCDLKKEFNKQINASSAVIFVVGDKTATRMAGSACERAYKPQDQCSCTPYKQNANGSKQCKVVSVVSGHKSSEEADVGEINSFSYLRHEFEQAKRKKKTVQIIIVYNSTRKEKSWLPSYMSGYEEIARPFWKYDAWGNRVGDYAYIKEALGYD